MYWLNCPWPWCQIYSRDLLDPAVWSGHKQHNRHSLLVYANWNWSEIPPISVPDPVLVYRFRFYRLYPPSRYLPGPHYNIAPEKYHRNLRHSLPEWMNPGLPHSDLSRNLPERYNNKQIRMLRQWVNGICIRVLVDPSRRKIGAVFYDILSCTRKPHDQLICSEAGVQGWCTESAWRPAGTGRVPNTWNSFIPYPLVVPRFIPTIFIYRPVTGLLNSVYTAVLPLTWLTVVQLILSSDTFKSKSFPFLLFFQFIAILHIHNQSLQIYINGIDIICTD